MYWFTSHFRVHPRSRGEYQQKRIKKAVCSGSPPLTRGIRFPVAQSRVTSGFTPAHAGNTEGLGGWNCRHRVHPRSRGEYFSCSLFRSTSGSGVHPRSRGEYRISHTEIMEKSGSPPLTRGILIVRASYPYTIRFTPAHAGNTLRHRFSLLRF